MLEHRGVVLIEPDKEPIYILSRAEALGQSAEAEEEKTKPAIKEIPDSDPTPFDDGQSETEDDWRSELAAELNDLDFRDEDIDESEQSDEQTEQESEKPKDKEKPTTKKEEKGIKDRKKKPKPQLSMFDLLEQSEEEQMIARQLKSGSGIQHGKFRIFDKYQENPTAKTFADFLKNEYGNGSASMWGGDCRSADRKGLSLSTKDEQGRADFDRMALTEKEVSCQSKNN